PRYSTQGQCPGQERDGLATGRKSAVLTWRSEVTTSARGNAAVGWLAHEVGERASDSMGGAIPPRPRRLRRWRAHATRRLPKGNRPNDLRLAGDVYFHSRSERDNDAYGRARHRAAMSRRQLRRGRCAGDEARSGGDS